MEKKKKLLKVSTYASKKKKHRQTIYDWINRGSDDKGKALDVVDIDGTTYIRI